MSRIVIVIRINISSSQTHRSHITVCYVEATWVACYLADGLAELMNDSR
jgi:hypothetical protein